MKQKIIFITGPTGSGKSELAIWLAKKLNAEIINADSRQVYKKLDVGSGKISKLEQKEINHYLLDIASPRQNFSLGRWLKLAEQAVRKIFKKGKIPIFCGGTNLYLRAIKEGWVLPEIKPDYKLRNKLEKLPVEKLFAMLKKIDSERAKTIEPKNKRRLIRALEITKAMAKVPKLKKEPKYDTLIIAIAVPWKKDENDKSLSSSKNLFPNFLALELKIKQRFYKRFPGIIKEIKKLRKLGLSLKRIMSFGLSYYWLGKYFEGKILLDEAKEKSCQAEINFAKRQLRELKKISGIIWIKNNKQALRVCKNFLNK